MTTVRSKAPGTLGKRVLYRTIDTTTLTGLRLAERLHTNGWKVAWSSFWTVRFWRFA